MKHQVNRFLIIGILSSFAFLAFVFAIPGDHLWVQAQQSSPTIQATTTLPVRSVPSINGNQIGILSTGVTRTVTGKNANGLWLQISHEGQSGWVCAEYAIDNGLLDQVPVTDQSNEDCEGHIIAPVALDAYTLAESSEASAAGCEQIVRLEEPEYWDNAQEVIEVQVSDRRIEPNGNISANIKLISKTALTYGILFSVETGAIHGSLEALLNVQNPPIPLSGNIVQNLGRVEFEPDTRLNIRLNKFGFSREDAAAMLGFDMLTLAMRMDGFDYDLLTESTIDQWTEIIVHFIDWINDAALKNSLLDAGVLTYDLAQIEDPVTLLGGTLNLIVEHPDVLIDLAQEVFNYRFSEGFFTSGFVGRATNALRGTGEVGHDLVTKPREVQVTLVAYTSSVGFTVGAGRIDDLVKAIDDANRTPSPDTICLEPGVYNISSTSEPDTIFAVLDGLPLITSSISIVGVDAANTILQAQRNEFPVRVFQIAEMGRLSISHVTIQNSSAATTGGMGGAILNRGVLEINSSVLRDNGADFGGGIYNEGGEVAIVDSTISGNSVRREGAGIYNNNGTITITRSIISDNETQYGFLGGAGIANEGGTVTIDNSQLIGNQTPLDGGALANRGGTVRIVSSCIIDNSLPSIYNDAVSPPIDATNNWWGAIDGPSGVGPGSGDAVSGNIHFLPFFTQAIVGCEYDEGTTKSLHNGLIAIGDDFENTIRLVNPNGTFIRQVARFTGFTSCHIRFSPDGQHLAYSTSDSGGLRILEVATGETMMPFGDHGGPVVWSPDNTQVTYWAGSHFDENTDAYEGPPGLWAVNIQTGEKQLLTTSEIDLSSARFTKWSPDGRHLGFSVTDQSKIVIILADGSGEIVNTLDGNSFDWSPDGKRIVYDGLNDSGLFITAVDGSETRLVYGDQASRPLWSPDGRHIAFLKSVPIGLFGALATWVLDIETGQANQLPRGVDTGPLQWSPDSRYLLMYGEGNVIQVIAINEDQASFIGVSGGCADWQALDNGHDESVGLVNSAGFLNIATALNNARAWSLPNVHQGQVVADIPAGTKLVIVSGPTKGPIQRNSDLEDEWFQVRFPESEQVLGWVWKERLADFRTESEENSSIPSLSRTLYVTSPRLFGDDVRAVQQRLTALGYAPGEIDGYYGPITETAVSEFQGRNQITVDGIVGPETWNRLFSNDAV